MNRRYIDAVLQDSRCENENKALISMLENIHHDSIAIADRNYDSYNNIGHPEAKGIKYVIRIKEYIQFAKHRLSISVFTSSKCSVIPFFFIILFYHVCQVFEN
ncbi:MAG: transposase [Clostridia bacterium]|nr:transposase [Clostridia bacterium]